MPLALRRYVGCLAIVCAAMTLYALLVAPWLQTPSRPSPQLRRTTTTGQTANWWSELFPGDAWQNQRPMVIQTEQGTLLFKSWTTLDSGEKLNLSPLTLIVPLSNQARHVTIGDVLASAQVYQNSSLAIVEAPEGADIEFQRAPDWTSGAIPPVVRGMLVGTISLKGIRPETEAERASSPQIASAHKPSLARTQWSLRTANLRIEGRRVWTNNDVELIFGNSRALGSDLSITLKRDLMSSEATGGEGQFSLLKALELRSIREVLVRLEEGGLWKGLPLGRPEVIAAHAQVPATMTLMCKGMLQLDFDHSQANLSDHVHIQHRFDNESHSDQFLCHELTARFSTLDVKAAAATSSPSSPRLKIGPLQIDSIDALGIDTVGPRPAQNTVQLLAPNIASELLAKRFKIDFSDKFHAILVDSRNGRSSEGARSGLPHISVKYLENVLHTPELRYGMVPTNQNLSWLSAAGPGEIQSASDSPMGSATARWQRALVMRPAESPSLIEGNSAQAANALPQSATSVQSIATTTDPNRPLDQQFSTDVHQIILDGEAELEAPGRGQLRGQQIVMTMRSVESNTPAATTTHAPSTTASTTRSTHTTNNRSSRLENLDAYAVSPSAPGTTSGSKVVLGNPTQRIEVQSLHFQFLYPDTGTKSTGANTTGSSSAGSSSMGTDRLELSDAAGRPMRQWVSPPTGQSPPSADALLSSATVQSPSTAALPPLGIPLQLAPHNASGRNAAGSGMAGSPGQMASLTGMPGITNLPAGQTRVLVIGKQLHSKIIMASPKPWMDQMIVTGPVVVSPDGPQPSSTANWNVAGNELMLNGGVDEQYELQVVGKPSALARLSFGDGWIEGPVVRLSQRTGHMWIEHPGTLCVPVGLMSQSGTMSQSGAGRPAAGPNSQGLLNQSGIEWIEPIKCRWKGGMLFNGLTATIRGDIDFDGYARTGPDRLLFLHGRCDTVEVRLSENVNLGNPGQTSATIHSITLRDNVDIRTAQKNLQGVRVSLEEIILPELSFEVATNTVVGRGPGQIHSQHQSSGSGLGQLAASSSSTSGTSPAGTHRFQGLHLMFRDFMEMKLAEKQLAFHGRVEVGVGPIPALEHPLQLDSMRVLQPEQSLLRGDRLNIYDTSDITGQSTASLSEGAWEMAALGNVSFETRSENGELVGRASRLTYVQAKDLLVIGGDPRIPAEIRHRPAASSQYGLAILSLWQGSINTRDFRPSGELQMAGNTQIIPRTTPIPDNWKTGSVNGSADPTQSSTNPNPSPSRPRDSVNDWFKPPNP